MEQREYRCVKRTRKAFADAFVALAKTRPINKITVKALCEKTQMSRNAFYFHYEDINDLRQEIENNLLNEIRALLADLGTVGFPQNVLEVIRSLIDLHLERRDVCLMLLDDAYYGTFTLRIYEIFSNFFYPFFVRYNGEESRAAFEYYYTFISDGFFGMARRFLNDPSGFPREKFSALCYTFIKRLMVPQSPSLDFLNK